MRRRILSLVLMFVIVLMFTGCICYLDSPPQKIKGFTLKLVPEEEYEKLGAHKYKINEKIPIELLKSTEVPIKARLTVNAHRQDSEITFSILTN